MNLRRAILRQRQDGWRADLRELIRDHYEHQLDDVQLVQRVIEILARYPGGQK